MPLSLTFYISEDIKLSNVVQMNSQDYSQAKE